MRGLAAACRRVENAFRRAFEDGREIGATVSIRHRGQDVLTLADGRTGRSAESPAWSADTPAPVYSATKGPAAAAFLLVLHEAGADLSSRAAEFWPEFGQAGKESITIRQILSHQAGLAALDRAVSALDHEAVAAALAAQPPLWDPGSQHGYHPRTFGYLIDELSRRICGEFVADVWERRVGRRLGIDFWIRRPAGHHPEIARLVPPKVSPSDEENPFRRAMTDPSSLTRRAFESPAGLHAAGEISRGAAWDAGLSAFGGVGSAPALASFYSHLIDGSRSDIIPPQVQSWLSTQIVEGVDAVLLEPTSFSAGMMMNARGSQLLGPSRRAFGHPGAGGSLAFADPENEIAFAYVMNQMERAVLPKGKAASLVGALYGTGRS